MKFLITIPEFEFELEVPDRDIRDFFDDGAGPTPQPTPDELVEMVRALLYDDITPLVNACEEHAMPALRAVVQPTTPQESSQ